jgi:hypothetical protein
MESSSARYGHWFQPAWQTLVERVPNRYAVLMDTLRKVGVEEFVAARRAAPTKNRPPFWITGPGWYDVSGARPAGPEFDGANMLTSLHQFNLQFLGAPEAPGVDCMVVAWMTSAGGAAGSIDLYPVQNEVRAHHLSESSTLEEQAVQLDKLAQTLLSAELEDPYHGAYFGLFGDEPLVATLGDKLEEGATLRRLVRDGREIGWMMAERCSDAPTVVIEHWLFQCARPPARFRLQAAPPEEQVSTRGGFYALAAQAPARWLTRIGIQGIDAPPSNRSRLG